MANRWYPLLFNIAIVVSILLPFVFISWSWIRVLRRPITADKKGRATAGTGALWVVSAQLLATLAVLVFLVVPSGNFDIWLDWLPLVCFLSVVVIALALIDERLHASKLFFAR